VQQRVPPATSACTRRPAPPPPEHHNRHRLILQLTEVQSRAGGNAEVCLHHGPARGRVCHHDVGAGELGPAEMPGLCRRHSSIVGADLDFHRMRLSQSLQLWVKGLGLQAPAGYVG